MIPYLIVLFSLATYIQRDYSISSSKPLLPNASAVDRDEIAGDRRWRHRFANRTAKVFHGVQQRPRCRVGSSKVAQLAAIARRRCLPHDCHFKCAIMAAGLAKKNAILRNSSGGCLTGRALRRLGFTRCSLFLSLSSFRSPREHSPPAFHHRSHSLSFSHTLSAFLFLALA